MYKRLVITADSHTQGEPSRLVIGGFIHYPGNTMRAKQICLAEEHDEIRKILMGEPRGHHDMFGGFVTPPVTDDGDLGIIWMDNNGYLDMCGHGTIGLCTTVVELGMVKTKSPCTEIKIDTPAGRVNGYALFENGRVTRAGFQNIPSFCTAVNERVTVDGLGTIEVGIAYGGNFFAVVEAEAIGLEIALQNMTNIRRAGRQIKRAVNDQLDVRHPLNDDISGLDIVTFIGPPQHPRATYQNVHVFADGQVDRSPGGTGTSAVLAFLIAKGTIKQQDSVVAEGIAGGLFEGRVVETWEENGQIYHIPDITSQAHLTGVHHFFLDAQDPMGYLPQSL